jgi:hypothetical protein
MNRATAFLMAVVVSVCGSQLHGQQAKPVPGILAGIREVNVTLAQSPLCASTGLDTVNVRVEVELALRRMGVRVVEKTPVTFHAAITCYPVQMTDGSAGLTEIHLQVEIVEAVTPFRTGTNSYWATTWQSSAMNYVPPSSSVSTPVIEGFRRLLSGFENEWLAANPKRE